MKLTEVEREVVCALRLGWNKGKRIPAPVRRSLEAKGWLTKDGQLTTEGYKAVTTQAWEF